MRRALVITALLAVSPAAAVAESQAAIAAQLDRDGTALLAHDHADAAAEKFRDAFARVPDPRYAYHLCDAEHRLGHGDNARQACDAAFQLNPGRDLAAKIAAMRDQLRAERLRDVDH
jgi:hypothetical protein